MDNLENRTLSIEKKLNADINLVWRAWSDPKQIAIWWGPKGMETVVEEHDFQTGGTWKYSMKMPNGSDFIGEGKYLEIVEFEKIVTTADFKPMTEDVVLEIMFEAHGAYTMFKFNCIHKTEEYCQAQEKMGFMNGWGSTFQRLAEYVES